MSQYTNPTDTEIQAMLAEFIDDEVTSYKLLSGGSQNTNYQINTLSHKYVLTICEEKSIQETEQLVYLLEHLAKHDFPSSVVIRSKAGQPISLWKEKPIMLKAFIDGKITDQIALPLLELCGRKLAQLHRIPPPEYLPHDLCFGLNQFHEVELYASDSPFHQWLSGISHLVNDHLSEDLPKALIHSDIFFSNVIISPEESDATIMDFEEACYYYRLFDIGMMIVGLCSCERTLDLQKAKAILKGYQSKTTLLEIEKESLQAFMVYAAAATAFWRHRQFNYIKPDKEQKNRYKEMRDVADFARELNLSPLFK